ncbi:SusD/RagB family nutrient-binding outer membrane lipoprotein [Fodinibius salsisoli]|uniref:SusD/RagB family nutrient-binding outer membrane lipoprotein n=1 Tax=Fodinibius salsisoli TaxID=2820877 RepID=A0ABT3PPY8_9BACT|nr:SusD/RagB family nutrient-binding outer membrane lipoprotein [Fodinibius salsisoli]MCW9707915.1 SusD/RagB family nutrient-binding outer membrane lipoprotein [Fodinibius salsisoli]
MKRLILVLLTLGLFVNACDRSNFAGTNQDPSTVVEPDVVYLFTSALQQMEQGPDHYTQWFYDNSQYMLPWSQVSVRPGGNGSQLNEFGAPGNRIGKWYELMEPLFEIRHHVDENLSGQEQKSYEKLKAITYAIQIYYGIHVTDVYGARAYTEAMQGRYTNPPMLTPQWDTQEELFNTWLSELNSALEVLASTPEFEGEPVNQVSLGEQDFVYGGDWTKWAKFMNSLKLRIATRLLHQDQGRALQIAENVTSNQFGPITLTEDNFNWKGSVQFYGPTSVNSAAVGPGARNLVNFLRENKDPRLKLLFDKNDFNSRVIQGFYDAGKEDNIPSYIQQYIESSVVDGQRVFEGWKAPGEPWVRYFGAPVAPDSARSGTVAEEYFRTQNWQLGSKTYEPKANYKMELYATNRDITYPDIPERTVIDEQDHPYHNNLFSAAETHLYLAEFAALGANLPNNAQYYLQEGIRQSVETYDWLANQNGILYYDEPYDTEYGASVSLKPGEVQDLLTREAYSLAGSSQQEQLEKIYIQQFIHFIAEPTQLYVTSLRSGIPQTDSQYLERVPFEDGPAALTIPRRFVVEQPTQDNINYQNILDALEAQGFSPGSNNPQTLHDERIWYDQNAPDWGEGPNY